MLAERMIDLNDYRSRRPQEPPSLTSALEAFRDAIEATGLGRPDVVADGEIHRFDLPDEKGGKKGGWYVLYADDKPCPAGAFGSWKHDFSEKWSLKANFELSSDEVRRLTERHSVARAERDEARRKESDEAASSATAILAASPDATDEHPYLQRKQVRAFGLKLGERNTLLAPMYNTRGDIRGLERIKPNGDKLFLKDIDPKGVFGWIEGDQSSIYLVEGYSTGASVHMATGSAVAIAFNAGNLEAAAASVKESFPGARLIIAADNDQWTTKQDGTPWNVGREKAQRAANSVGATVVWPEFKDLSTRPTDFNDLHVLEGLDAVQSQIKGYSVTISEWRLSRLNGRQAPEREWLIDKTIPLGAAIILAAPGGTGKGMLTLDMALKVAGEPRQGVDLSGADQVMGNAVRAHGPVVMLAAEDDQDEIHRRAETLCGEDRFPDRLYVICMPDLDTPHGIVAQGKLGNIEVSPFWREIEQQIQRVKPRLVVVDPLSCFVFGDLNDRTLGAHVMGLFTTLARRVNAAVVIVHHLNKLKDSIKNLDQARNAISGSAGFVDHGRGAYVLWPEDEAKSRELCKSMELEYQRHRVVRGGLAKANFPGDKEERVYMRMNNGLLVPVDQAARETARTTWIELLALLERAVGNAAAQGMPFQHTGKHGLYEKRERLPERLRTQSRNMLDSLARHLLDARRIDKFRPAKGGKTEVWLDVPGGPFAIGIGELVGGEFELVYE